MAELYLTGMKSTAVQKWFGVKSGRDGLTWFHVLGVSEDGAADGAISQRLAERLARLESITVKFRASQRQDHVELATQLENDRREVGAWMQDPQRRQEYTQALTQHRQELFERTVSMAVVPGRPPGPQKMQSFLEEAQEYGVAEGDARRIIDTLVGFERTGNPFAAYDVVKVSDDPAWPTAFDLLGLEEDETEERRIREQLQTRLAKANEMERKTTDMDRKREARKRREEFEVAAATLLAEGQRQAYLREITQQRADKFAQQVQTVWQPGQPVSPETVINLLAMARRLRLSDAHSRQLITQHTGFADYVGLISQRKTPVLGHVESLVLELPSNVSAEASHVPLTICNEGAGTLTGHVDPVSDWLAIHPDIIQTRSLQELTVFVHADALPRGVPKTGQVAVETNGGAQTVTVEVLIGGGDVAATPTERLLGGVIYLVGTAFFPLAMAGVFIFQNQSRYLTMQSAQAAIIGTLFMGVIMGGSLAMEFCCMTQFLEWPLFIFAIGIWALPITCLVLSLMGKPVRIPVIIDYAQRFAY